ncbi:MULTISPECIES: TolC family protein [Hungatella]|uniref:TolC family protein n=1 Tax=Hungatella hathewayi TaxID=154046 RepID=A0AAW9WI04_9FIRM|nr:MULTISPECIES: TolC family protein [Hungatella]MCQ4829649.1 TolC family protein [Hungatella sp. SL.1.14]MUB64582.1 TolC family protein [Hungatella hathewayi]CUQ10368.1 Outer membrane efflux protein [Hungatella hathewayi]
MKKWKQISACCMAAVLAAAVPTGTAWAGSPEFARSAEEWAKLRDNVMEYDELAGLIHEYNVTVQNNQRDFNEKKNKTSDEIAQDYRDAADAIRSSMSGEDDAGSILSDAMSEAQALTLEQQADDSVEDSEIFKMTYDQTEKTLVSNAQANMILYHQKVLDLELKQKNRELLAATYDSVALKMNNGMATQMDLLTARENLQNADAAILTAQSDLENTRQKLCVMLGWRYDASPEIMGIPSADLNRITAMDPSADKEKALENNYTLRINRKKLANSSSNSKKESLQMTIDDNIQRIGASVDSAYKNVIQAQTAYQQASVALDAASKNMEAAERKMTIGTISRLDYLSQQYAYLQAQTAMKNADMDLFQAMESYDWNVNGLASASAGM